MKKKSEIILITGGAGFIGSTLTCRLAKENVDVVVVDDLSVGGKGLLKDTKIKFYKADISDKNKLDNIFAEVQPTIVIHLAAKHYIPYCNDHIDDTIASNIHGTLNIVELMGKYHISRMIFASSAAVYKPSASAHKEIDSLEPVDIYGISKQVGEGIIESLCPLFDVNYTIFRFFNVFGPHDLVPHLIPSMIYQAQKGNIIQVGNVASKRDYIWVDDIVSGILKSLNKEKSHGQKYNLGSGRAWSVKEVFEKINKIAENRLALESVDKKERKIDAPILLADIKKAAKDLGWRPKIDIDEGLCYAYKHKSEFNSTF